VIEVVLVVSMQLWLVDVFGRRFDHQGCLAWEASRAAFAAFVAHQIVLVGLVLAGHGVPWTPEAKWLLVSVVGVPVSVGLGALRRASQRSAGSSNPRRRPLPPSSSATTSLVVDGGSGPVSPRPLTSARFRVGLPDGRVAGDWPSELPGRQPRVDASMTKR
jgi:hypothetical protein